MYFLFLLSTLEMILFRLDLDREEKRRLGELTESDADAVITALDMEDKWKKEVLLINEKMSYAICMHSFCHTMIF